MPSVTTPRTRAATSTHAGPDAPAVQATGATRIYGDGGTAVRALAGVEVTIQRGEFAAIMGPSGSGKSTLLHSLAGLDRLTDGEVAIAGTPLSGLSERQLTRLRRDQVGFVFQTYNLVPTLSAADNITLPVDLAGGTLDTAWFDQLVAVLGIGDRLDHRPAELSGGQQQRVAAARALITRPTVVFADEPTGALDSNASSELLSFLRRAADEFRQTIVMVTHDPRAASYADRVLFLADGRIVDELPTPDADTVLERMKVLENHVVTLP